MCNYTYAGPALLVLPLCLMSLINLFLAGPPLKTIVIDSVSAESASYSTSRLDFMQLEVDRKSAHFTLLPKDEMTHFFVVTCHTPAHDVPLQLNATVAGIRSPHSTKWSATPTSDGRAETLASDTTAGPQKDRALQLFQPMLGYSTYHVFISALAPEGAPAASAPALPAIEYRLSYVPTRFTHIQICVRAFFSFTSACMLVCYCIAMCSGPGPRETGQAWVGALLLLLLLGVNEPLYIARVMLGGNHAMYVVGALGQTLFFGGLFLFWLVFADGMGSRQDLCLLLPKLLLVALFVGSSALLFVSYGRVPDRIALDEMRDPAQRALVRLEITTYLWPRRGGLMTAGTFPKVLLLCASVASVGLWLAGLISRTLYRLGWKKLEYICEIAVHIVLRSSS